MFESVKQGMANTRAAFTEKMNVLLDRGPDVDEDFWDGLEEALILSDVGAQTANDIVESMRVEATRKALPDAYAVMDALAERIAETFTLADKNFFDESPQLVLFVGINGAGKTTTVGKIAAEQKAKGRKVLLGSGDTFRAAAIEQLEEWSRRAGVEIVQRERGSDPASVCYDTIERAEALGSDLVLIDTAGRLHTSDDLMRELQKVVNVVRKRANMPVRCVLVIDATTGQNGLSQAQQFNRSLDLDAVIVTKLDGTAKGGIALAVSHELGLPIAKVGVGESLDDLQDFDPFEFSAALIGAEPEYILVDEDGTERVVTKEEFEADQYGSVVLSNDGEADAAEDSDGTQDPCSSHGADQSPLGDEAGLEHSPEPSSLTSSGEPADDEDAPSASSASSELEQSADGASSGEPADDEAAGEDAKDAADAAEPEDDAEAADDDAAEAADDADEDAEAERDADDTDESDDDAEADDDADKGSDDADGTDDADEEDGGADDDAADADGKDEDAADDTDDADGADGSDDTGDAADAEAAGDEEEQEEEKPKEGRMKRFFKWLGSSD